jgi:hypothetical protein
LGDLVGRGRALDLDDRVQIHMINFPLCHKTHNDGAACVRGQPPTIRQYSWKTIILLQERTVNLSVEIASIW